ncbi:MAG: GNAT family N-acetyltransferase [Cupriavidus necator]
MRPHYATEADWLDIKALLHASSLSVAGVQERISQYMVIRDNAGLLGCAGLERYENAGVLRGLAVAQRARSSGLGELLISAIVADVRREGIELIVLQTKNASGYFARLGFTPISCAELAPAVLASEAMRRDQAEIGTLMQIAL